MQKMRVIDLSARLVTEPDLLADGRAVGAHYGRIFSRQRLDEEGSQAMGRANASRVHISSPHSIFVAGGRVPIGNACVAVMVCGGAADPGRNARRGIARIDEGPFPSRGDAFTRSDGISNYAQRTSRTSSPKGGYDGALNRR